MPTALAQVKTGKLKGLAVTSAERSKLVANMPTVSEFVPGFQITAWQRLFAPAATSPAILNRLAAEAQPIMRMPDVANRLLDMGMTSVDSSRSEFAAFVQGEIERWAEVVKVSGARAPMNDNMESTMSGLPFDIPHHTKPAWPRHDGVPRRILMRSDVDPQARHVAIISANE